MITDNSTITVSPQLKTALANKGVSAFQLYWTWQPKLELENKGRKDKTESVIDSNVFVNNNKNLGMHRCHASLPIALPKVLDDPEYRYRY